MKLKIEEKLSGLFSNYLPSAFVFAVLLTFVTIFSAFLFTESSLIENISYWGNNFWNLNKFAMEMTIILVTGSALALSPPVDLILTKIVNTFKGQTHGVILIFCLSTLCCLFNWGFGLIISSILVLKTLQSKKYSPGPLIASAYSGFLFWHGGLSGSIPLKLTSPSELVKDIIDVGQIPLSETIFSNTNLVILFANFIFILCLLIFLCKRTKAENNEIFVPKKVPGFNLSEDKFSEKIEASKLLLGLLVIIGAIFIGIYFYNGGSLNLGILSFVFLFLGIFASGSLKSFKTLFSQSIQNCSGVILQFPFYAGIMGVMVESGLGIKISEFMLSTANEGNFLFLSYITAGFLNFFVPSGGGQWAIQGPLLLPVAKELGVSLSHTSLAIAWGDAWTNMIQPFWAIPILGITGIKLSELMKYTFMVFVISGFVTSFIFAII